MGCVSGVDTTLINLAHSSHLLADVSQKDLTVTLALWRGTDVTLHLMKGNQSDAFRQLRYTVRFLLEGLLVLLTVKVS